MNGLRKSTVRRPTIHQKPEEYTGSQNTSLAHKEYVRRNASTTSRTNKGPNTNTKYLYITMLFKCFMLQSCKTLQSSPSLTTLDFDMSVGVYDDPNDLDMRSTISSATSKLLGKELVPRVMESLVTIGDVLDTDEKEALFQFDVIGDSSQTRRGD